MAWVMENEETLKSFTINNYLKTRSGYGDDNHLLLATEQELS